MKDTGKWDRLLQEALTEAAEPEDRLNEILIQRWREKETMKSKVRKRWYAGALVSGILLFLSVTTYAATQLLSAKEFVEQIGDPVLAEAFADPNAIAINQTQTSGEYQVTLHGVVSGEGLKNFYDAGEIRSDRTYAVVSIAMADGTPMPDTSDEEYGKVPFFISPLIKGVEPWRVNIVTMKGGYIDKVIDGIMYRLLECDSVEMFANRGVYLAISSSKFYDDNAFIYNETTGEIRPNPDYQGVSLLFDLPLDESKAEPELAEAYLHELVPPSDGQKNDDDIDQENIMNNINERIKQGTVIPGSVRELKVDEEGGYYYEFEDWHTPVYPESLFAEDQTGFSDDITVSGSADGTLKALQFHKDEDGVITGRLVLLPEGAMD